MRNRGLTSKKISRQEKLLLTFYTQSKLQFKRSKNTPLTPEQLASPLGIDLEEVMVWLLE